RIDSSKPTCRQNRCCKNGSDHRFRFPSGPQVARLTATGEHLATQLQDTKAELKETREDGRALQAELLALARHDGKAKK
ncbi:hypothetical protein GF617_12765, partial [Lelliottia sp. RWM.1]|nr:hypothetical protein [Lelliottia sp. RWM.1]